MQEGTPTALPPTGTKEAVRERESARQSGRACAGERVTERECVGEREKVAERHSVWEREREGHSETETWRLVRVPALRPAGGDPPGWIRPSSDAGSGFMGVGVQDESS